MEWKQYKMFNKLDVCVQPNKYFNKKLKLQNLKCLKQYGFMMTILK